MLPDKPGLKNPVEETNSHREALWVLHLNFKKTNLGMDIRTMKIMLNI